MKSYGAASWFVSGAIAMLGPFGVHLYLDSQDARDADHELFKIAVACNRIFFELDDAWLQQKPPHGYSLDAIASMREACGSDILRVEKPN